MNAAGLMLLSLALIRGLSGIEADDLLWRSEVRGDLLAGRSIVWQGSVEYLDLRLTDFQLALLDSAELMLLRNSIFARLGYSFRNSSIASHFDGFDWYDPSLEDVSSLLSETDRRNIAGIRHFEDRLEDPGPGLPGTEELAGFWHGNPCVGSGYSERYLLFPEGDFVYRENTMDGSARLLELSGAWNTEAGHLVLEADSAVYLEGGEIVEPYASWGSDYVIEGGREVPRALDPVLTLRLPVDGYTPDYASTNKAEGFEHLTVPYMMIGTGGFWRMHADPSIGWLE